MRQYVTHMCVHVFQHDSGRKSNMLIYVIMISSRNALFDATMSDSFSHLLKKKNAHFLSYSHYHTEFPFSHLNPWEKIFLGQAKKAIQITERILWQAMIITWIWSRSMVHTHRLTIDPHVCTYSYINKMAQSNSIQVRCPICSIIIRTIHWHQIHVSNATMTRQQMKICSLYSAIDRLEAIRYFFIWIQHLSITFLFHFFFLSFINPLRMSWPALKEKWAKPSNIAWKKIMRICTWIYFHSIHYLIKMYNLLT